ncbi:MAG TPA: PEGA domain-containing protein, partial [Kofleriaceae bacterium]|nr:PEGA domain-containing protein [Kofleriaceae bacterium]
PDMGYAPPPVGYMPPPYHAPPPVQRGGAGKTALKIFLVLVLLGGMAAGGYFGYMALMVEDDDSGQSTTAAGPPAPSSPADKPATVPADAGAATASPTPPPASADGGPAAPTPPAAGATDLSISSNPPDAKVYLDGAPVGVTPLRLDGSGDRHKLALILPGHKLHTAEIEGRGAVHVDLEEVTPSSGPAGIKVKCKAKNRYYVIVDGVDTGQTCPTERIGSTLGEHTVEVYDPENDSRKAFPINIIQTRLSHRVKVDY